MTANMAFCGPSQFDILVIEGVTLSAVREYQYNFPIDEEHSYREMGANPLIWVSILESITPFINEHPSIIDRKQILDASFGLLPPKALKPAIVAAAQFLLEHGSDLEQKEVLRAMQKAYGNALTP